MAGIGTLEEFAFIGEIVSMIERVGYGDGVRLGPGDDAAALRSSRCTLASTDTQTENVHFRTAWLNAAELGCRAFRVAVSDISAMGGRPQHALLALSLPPHSSVVYARSLLRGFIDDARSAGVTLVGGNLSSSAQISITVTVLGAAGRRLLGRDAARPGHDLYVTGTLGDAAAGVAQLEAGKRRGNLVAAYRKPPLRCAVAQLLNASGLVRAMIDLSDGLLQDLRHMCRASEVSAMIDLSLLPLSRSLRRWGGSEALSYALGGGDDYELLFSARAGSEDTLREVLAPLSCEVSRIGKILRHDAGAEIVDEGGEVLELDKEGYRHFERRL